MKAGYSGREALITSAFLEERKNWEDKYSLLKEAFNFKLEELRQSYDDVKYESRIKKFLFKKIAGKLTPAENNVEIITDELNDLITLITEHEDNQPDPLRYELAALGNNLFKPR